MFESRFIDGREAQDLGLVNRVIDRESIEQETLGIRQRA